MILVSNLIHLNNEGDKCTGQLSPNGKYLTLNNSFPLFMYPDGAEILCALEFTIYKNNLKVWRCRPTDIFETRVDVVYETALETILYHSTPYNSLDFILN